MEITVELWDGFENETVFWTFRVNANGYIDIVIEDRIMDTLLELGEIKSLSGFHAIVDALLNHWKVQWKEKIVH